MAATRLQAQPEQQQPARHRKVLPMPAARVIPKPKGAARTSARVLTKQAADRAERAKYGRCFKHVDVRAYVWRRLFHHGPRRGRGGVPPDDSLPRPITFLKLAPHFQHEILAERSVALSEELSDVGKTECWRLYAAVPGALCLTTQEVARRVRAAARLTRLPYRAVVTAGAAQRALLLARPRALEMRATSVAAGLRLPLAVAARALVPGADHLLPARTVVVVAKARWLSALLRCGGHASLRLLARDAAVFRASHRALGTRHRTLLAPLLPPRPAPGAGASRQRSGSRQPPSLSPVLPVSVAARQGSSHPPSLAATAPYARAGLPSGPRAAEHEGGGERAVDGEGGSEGGGEGQQALGRRASERRRAARRGRARWDAHAVRAHALLARVLDCHPGLLTTSSDRLGPALRTLCVLLAPGGAHTPAVQQQAQQQHAPTQQEQQQQQPRVHPAVALSVLARAPAILDLPAQQLRAARDAVRDALASCAATPSNSARSTASASASSTASASASSSSSIARTARAAGAAAVAAAPSAGEAAALANDDGAGGGGGDGDDGASAAALAVAAVRRVPALLVQPPGDTAVRAASLAAACAEATGAPRADAARAVARMAARQPRLLLLPPPQPRPAARTRTPGARPADAGAHPALAADARGSGAGGDATVAVLRRLRRVQSVARVPDAAAAWALVERCPELLLRAGPDPGDALREAVDAIDAAPGVLAASAAGGAQGGGSGGDRSAAAVAAALARACPALMAVPSGAAAAARAGLETGVLSGGVPRVVVSSLLAGAPGLLACAGGDGARALGEALAELGGACREVGAAGDAAWGEEAASGRTGDGDGRGGDGRAAAAARLLARHPWLLRVQLPPPLPHAPPPPLRLLTESAIDAVRQLSRALSLPHPSDALHLLLVAAEHSRSGGAGGGSTAAGSGQHPSSSSVSGSATRARGGGAGSTSDGSGAGSATTSSGSSTSSDSSSSGSSSARPPEEGEDPPLVSPRCPPLRVHPRTLSSVVAALSLLRGASPEWDTELRSYASSRNAAALSALLAGLATACGRARLALICGVPGATARVGVVAALALPAARLAAVHEGLSLAAVRAADGAGASAASSAGTAAGGGAGASAGTAAGAGGGAGAVCAAAGGAGGAVGAAAGAAAGVGARDAHGDGARAAAPGVPSPGGAPTSDAARAAAGGSGDARNARTGGAGAGAAARGGDSRAARTGASPGGPYDAGGAAPDGGGAVFGGGRPEPEQAPSSTTHGSVPAPAPAPASGVSSQGARRGYMAGGGRPTRAPLRQVSIALGGLPAPPTAPAPGQAQAPAPAQAQAPGAAAPTGGSVRADGGPQQAAGASAGTGAGVSAGRGSAARRGQPDSGTGNPPAEPRQQSRAQPAALTTLGVVAEPTTAPTPRRTPQATTAPAPASATPAAPVPVQPEGGQRAAAAAVAAGAAARGAGSMRTARRGVVDRAGQPRARPGAPPPPPLRERSVDDW
ncbi:hypothetical protein FOA52_010756 [Chlamydomonas sp. UWO 241]|nr:hypothetical protein FOA52_010756 [Chlamydomonas sp. UWO 241]